MTKPSLSVFYDGECPVCSHYVRHTRLKQTFEVSIVNLRENPQRVAEFGAKGFNVDNGMIVIFDDKTYHGAEAMHILALLSTPSGFFNRCNRLIFSNSWLARTFYPILVSGRNLLLFLLGRKKINDA